MLYVTSLLLYFTHDLLKEHSVFDQSWHRRSAFANDGGLQALVKCYRLQDVHLRARALLVTVECVKPGYKEANKRMQLYKSIPSVEDLLLDLKRDKRVVSGYLGTNLATTVVKLQKYMLSA